MRPLQVQLVREPALNPGRKLTDPAVTADWLARETPIPFSDREHFVALHLNVRHRVIGWEIISTGSLTASVVHPREVFKGAILSNAAAIICAHNHPSGDPVPSAEDWAITERLRRAGQTLGIELLDHVIVTPNGKFTSLRDACERKVSDDCS